MLKFIRTFQSHVLTRVLLSSYFTSQELETRKKSLYRIRASIKRNEMVMHVSKAFVENGLRNIF